MTIKTLEFIHGLLEREKSSMEELYRQARDALADLDPDDPAYPDAKDVRDRAYSSFDVARSALFDFENKIW